MAKLGYSKKNRLTAVLLFVIMLIASVVVLMPFYFMLISSFKPGDEIMRHGLSLTVDFDVLTLDSYRALLTYRDGIYLD